MAMIFKGYRPRIARQMANGDKTLARWLSTATFAKTSNGYWMAWRSDEDSSSFLVMHHDNSVDGDICWLDDLTFDEAVAFIESGEYQQSSGMVLNLQIQDPVTGEWH